MSPLVLPAVSLHVTGSGEALPGAVTLLFLQLTKKSPAAEQMSKIFFICMVKVKWNDNAGTMPFC